MAWMSEAFGRPQAEYSRIVTNSTSLMLNDLWSKKKFPERPWSEQAITGFLSWIASHDTNNRIDRTSLGAGEREGRVASTLVRHLHCNLSHGIGRSGNLCEIQPKALGSSMLNCLANEFALQALHVLGMSSVRGAVVLPIATGMSLMMCMSHWRAMRPDASYVVFPRVDQKSCFKAILTAGFKPVVIEPVRLEDALMTDVASIQSILKERSQEVLCVLSTLSVFAPRDPDDIVEVGRLCEMAGVPHLVNNAYGLQSKECVRRIQEARLSGRVDAVVQSLDKNFQVPVGGAIVAFFKQSHAARFAQFYPGRASCVPSRDFVLTLLGQGTTGLVAQFEQQRRLFQRMRRELHSFAEQIGESVYHTPCNLISLAMTLSRIPVDLQTLFGAVLFSRGITGARVVSSSMKSTVIEGHEFINFGSHSVCQHPGYITIACGVGMTESEVDEFFVRLKVTFVRFCRKHLKNLTDLPEDFETEDEDGVE